jgi:hypothetical protein
MRSAARYESRGAGAPSVTADQGRTVIEECGLRLMERVELLYAKL